MGSDGGHYIPMGAFAVEVSINVGDMGSSELEHEAWMRDVEVARKALAPFVPVVTELADVYLRGDHPYRFLRDRLEPVFPELPSYSSRIVHLPLDHERLGPWLRSRKAAPPKLRYERFSLGLAGREDLTPVEKDKIVAGFNLSQRGPGGYLHGGPLPLHLFDHQLSGRFMSRVDLDDLLPSILEGGRLPEIAGKAFEKGPRHLEAWDVANSVWMLARDEDLEPWQAFCIQTSRRKWPDGDECFPEWVTGRRWIPGRGYVERSNS
jgi:hypothetical protein